MQLNDFDYVHILFICIFTSLFMYIEDVSFPEETSNRKIISRIIILGMFISFIYILNNYSSSIKYVIPMLYFGIGYCITSILFKTVLYDESYIKIKKKSE